MSDALRAQAAVGRENKTTMGPTAVLMIAATHQPPTKKRMLSRVAACGEFAQSRILTAFFSFAAAYVPRPRWGILARVQGPQALEAVGGLCLTLAGNQSEKQ